MVDLLRIKAVRLRVCVHPSVSSLCYHFVSVCMSGCLCLFVSLSLSLSFYVSISYASMYHCLQMYRGYI